MSNPVSGNSQTITAETTGYKKAWASGFRRLQLALAWWGVLILVGGWLHSTYSLAWGKPLTLTMWLVITGLGFVGNYLLAPAFIRCFSNFNCFCDVCFL